MRRRGCDVRRWWSFLLKDASAGQEIYAPMSTMWHVNTPSVFAPHLLGLCSREQDCQCRSNSINPHCWNNPLSSPETSLPPPISVSPRAHWVHCGEGPLFCVSSFFALFLVDRGGPLGGSLCFQFSPLSHPGKQHFQTQTNETRKMKHTILCFSRSPHCLSL